MFEHTPTDIEKRLEELSPESIEFLEKLPTFLCSELGYSGRSASMLIKYGRISETSASKKDVSANFETLVDFGVVEFADQEQARKVFQADRVQLYRTHWAVRVGSARDILISLKTLNPDSLDKVDKLLCSERAGTAAEPPKRIKKIIGNADSVEDFLKLLYEHSTGAGTENFFRGHNEASFELTPSLLRKWDNGSWKHLPDEDRLCKELLIAHYDEFQGDQYCFDRLVRMQHYELPTRLLDISGNPLVALFFACDGDKKR